MKFSSALATAVLSLFSLSAAQDVSVATVYRYVNATATVYANYCPCAVTPTLGGTGAAPTAGVVNNNGGNPAANVPTGNNNGGGGQVGAAPGSQPGGQSGGQSGTTYVTVIVQYQTTTLYNTFTTTITLGPRQTITSTITETITTTVPVTVTSTVTDGNGGASVNPNPNSLTSSSIAPFQNSSTSALATSSISGGAGVDPNQNTLLSSSASALVSVSVPVSIPVVVPSTSAADSVSATSEISAGPTSSAIVPTSTDAASTTAAASSTSVFVRPTNAVNALYAVGSGYENNIYIDQAGRVAVYGNTQANTGPPPPTSNPAFLFYVNDNGQSVYSMDESVFAYNEANAPTGTAVVIRVNAAAALADGLTIIGFNVNGDSTSLTAPNLEFYTDPDTAELRLYAAGTAIGDIPNAYPDYGVVASLILQPVATTDSTDAPEGPLNPGAAPAPTAD